MIVRYLDYLTHSRANGILRAASACNVAQPTETMQLRSAGGNHYVLFFEANVANQLSRIAASAQWMRRRIDVFSTGSMSDNAQTRSKTAGIVRKDFSVFYALDRSETSDTRC